MLYRIPQSRCKQKNFCAGGSLREDFQKKLVTVQKARRRGGRSHTSYHRWQSPLEGGHSLHCEFSLRFYLGCRNIVPHLSTVGWNHPRGRHFRLFIWNLNTIRHSAFWIASLHQDSESRWCQDLEMEGSHTGWVRYFSSRHLLVLKMKVVVKLWEFRACQDERGPDWETSGLGWLPKRCYVVQVNQKDSEPSQDRPPVSATLLNIHFHFHVWTLYHCLCALPCGLWIVTKTAFQVPSAWTFWLVSFWL